MISATVITYLFAGADLDKLAILGFRIPASYPIVFSWAAIGALVWFWWRYMITWVDADSRISFRQDFLVSLRKTPSFQRHLLKSIDLNNVARIAKNHNRSIAGVPLNLDSVTIDGTRRFIAKIQKVTLVNSENPPTHYDVSGKQLSTDKHRMITVPRWLHYSRGIPYFWWRAVRHEHFANLILPHVLFISAIALICCKFLGIDPAGIFRILSPATVYNMGTGT